MERLVGDCRAVLGPLDPDTLIAEGNLAVIYVCRERAEQVSIS